MRGGTPREVPAEVRDLARLLGVIEQMTAGIGGLLEMWPVSPVLVSERLRDLYDLGQSARPDLHVDRVVHDLTTAEVDVVCPRCGLMWHRDGTGPNGHTRHCLDCHRAMRREEDKRRRETA